jgi:predicted ATPase/DNA-binding XRE family transcriptional regulator
MSDNITLGQWLKGRRRAFGLTQEDLAEQIGCSDITIRKIESGERRPSRQVAELLAKCLAVPLEERSAFIEFARGSPLSQPTQGKLFSAPYNHTTNLPAPLTRIIGREEEILEARRFLIDAGVRLLTLTGPPGIGKTRLALEVASELVEKYEHGVFFVALAAINDQALVLASIAETLDVREIRERNQNPVLAGLLGYLRSKQILLVLDNLEQVVAAAPAIANLLNACPHLSVLATSREALHLRGEQQFPVPPLALPPLTDLSEPHNLRHMLSFSAIELFVQRASATKPHFELTEQNSQVIAALCSHLGGLPLAIELAASRVNLLSPQEIVARLRGTEPAKEGGEGSLKLLTGGARDLPPRQQTLRDAIEWSYRLLNSGEQTLFSRLGVFVGGCALSAAEAICNAGDDLPFAVLDGLASLVEKSLLKREETNSGSRFSMLEMIREYAIERLEESDEVETTRRLHAEYYLALAEGGEPMLQGPDQQVWLERLEMEYGNLRFALGWLLERGEVELAVQLANNLFRFWSLRGHFSEAHRWIDAISEKSNRAPSAMLLAVRISSADTELGGGDPDRALAVYEDALRVYRQLGDKRGMLYTLSNLGGLAQSRGEHEQAQAYYEESLALAESLGDKWFTADSLSGLGWVAHDRGDYAKAAAMFERSEQLDRERGDAHDIAARRTHQGTVALDAGDYTRAETILKESLAVQRQLGDQNCSARSLRGLGIAALAQGNNTEARTYLEESILLSREVGNKKNTAGCLEGFAELAISGGEAKRGAQLAGSAQVLRETIRSPLKKGERVLYDTLIGAARTELGEEEFAKAWGEGVTMTLDQAVEYALEGRNET